MPLQSILTCGEILVRPMPARDPAIYPAKQRTGFGCCLGEVKNQFGFVLHVTAHGIADKSSAIHLDTEDGIVEEKRFRTPEPDGWLWDVNETTPKPLKKRATPEDDLWGECMINKRAVPPGNHFIYATSPLKTLYSNPDDACPVPCLTFKNESEEYAHRIL